MTWLIKADEDYAAQINGNIEEAKPLVKSGVKSIMDGTGKVETQKGKITPREAVDNIYTGLGDLWRVFSLMTQNKDLWESYTTGKDVLEKFNPYDTVVRQMDNYLHNLIDHTRRIEDDIEFEKSVVGGRLRTAPKEFTADHLNSMREIVMFILSALKPAMAKQYKLPMEHELTAPGEPGAPLRRRHITEGDPRSDLRHTVQWLEDIGKEVEPEIELENLEIPGVRWIVKRQPGQMKRIPRFRKSIMKSVPTKITPWYERPQATK